MTADNPTTGGEAQRRGLSLRGLNMDRQLVVSSLIAYAERNHHHTDVVGVDSDGRLVRSDWGEIGRRARRLAAGLERAGISDGDRVATIAWNNTRHLEAYYGITGIGAVLHTVNPRLHDDQLVYILNHAGDRIVFVDADFWPIVERIADRCPTVEQWVRLDGAYEDFLADEPLAEWPDLDEWAAATLCYTSGTTGNPKGVLQSHRAIVLQSWATCTSDAHNVNSAESVLLAVPMYHVNGWAIPFAAALSGAKLVLPGPDLGPEALIKLINDEDVTLSAGVPTIWLGMVQHLDRHGGEIPSLRRIAVGGSAAPRSLMDTLEDDHGVFVSHVWGMTEMTQGSSGRFTHRVERMGRDEQRKRQAMAGREIYGVELARVDDEGRLIERSSPQPGELVARGPWVAGAYFEADTPGSHTTDSPDGSDGGVGPGWLRTGDVATINDEGYITLVDRAKDVIKSGGEWISSIDLENASVGVDGVIEAAVIGLAHERWGERPLLFCVTDGTVGKDAILEHLSGVVARWWLPDDVIFVDEIPHTGTGKIDKKVLREAYRDHVWGST